MPTGRLVDSVAQFWIGDLIGVVVTTPALLSAARIQLTAARPPSVETVAQAGAIVLALAVVFGSGLGAELKLFYVLFISLIFIATRPPAWQCATWSILLVQVGLIAALNFGGHEPGEFLDFQFLMLALALTGLFLGVTVEERRAAEHKLREKQFQLDRSLRAAAASELASALAHELNQPLSAVASYTRACQLLLADGDPDRELMPTLNKVVLEANRRGHGSPQAARTSTERNPAPMLHWRCMRCSKPQPARRAPVRKGMDRGKHHRRPRPARRAR